MKAIIPAIDISEGCCVRLNQGDFTEKKVYDANPIEIALQFVEWGAKRLHIVDLDAVFSRGNNRGIISEICRKMKSLGCIVEVGGGIRNESDVKAIIATGADRLILGTILINDFFEVQRWTHVYGSIFMASLDERDDAVQVSGWLKDSQVTVKAFLAQLKKISITAIAYTNIYDDGMLQGLNIEKGNAVAEQAHVPVILSGGIGSIEDIDLFMKNSNDSVSGLLVGKAIYEGRVDMKTVFERYPSPDCDRW